MNNIKVNPQIIVFIFIISLLISCTNNQRKYEFPEAIDLSAHYLFYIHGRIIEDQGLPAVSPEFGEYEYQAILEKFAENDFVVISEQRSKNTDVLPFARKIAGQVRELLDRGVPATNITVVGASKGAAITAFVSNILENGEINYVLLAICHPEVTKELMEDQIYLYGNVLSIYDIADDEYAGSCQEYFSFSKDKGLSRHDEIILNIGTGHGVLYEPLDEWMLPTMKWANPQ
jgi:hypothetical protein